MNRFKTRAALIGAISALAVAAACAPGTGAQVHAADTIAEDWSAAICQVVGPIGPVETIACSGVLAVEGLLSELTADGGLLSAPRVGAVASKTVVLKGIPKDQADLLLARHPAPGASR